jgi:hypothetical protein
MAPISRSLAASMAAHHGIVTQHELLRDGLSPNRIKALVRDGLLVRVHHGVMRIATSPDTFEARCLAACRSDAGLIITGPFERLTEWVLDRHTSVQTLWRLTIRLTSRGRPGSARVHRVMSRRSDWQRPAGSGLEVRVLRALEARGVGPLERQFPLRLPNGITIHADGADPRIRWAVEIDHVTWHGGRFDAQRDKVRDRNARRIGWQIDRVTDQDIATDFAAAIDELVDLHRLRVREVRRLIS